MKLGLMSAAINGGAAAGGWYAAQQIIGPTENVGPNGGSMSRFFSVERLPGKFDVGDLVEWGIVGLAVTHVGRLLRGLFYGGGKRRGSSRHGRRA